MILRLFLDLPLRERGGVAIAVGAWFVVVAVVLLGGAG